MIDELLNKLRYKCEGADIDFKSAQYLFNKGSEDTKGEILKDILAIANAWRDGFGYILLGFKDQRPHPAEVVGISESIDDAQLQQFVNSKVKPKLTFSYEEHVYQGKTVALITIPKQKRTFHLTHAYGKLKSNVVYVRRGSSTDEAEPQEIHEMMKADSGQGDMRLSLSILTEDNQSLPETIELRYLSFSENFPDYVTPEPQSNLSSLAMLNTQLVQDNHDYWRECAKYISVNERKIQMRFVLLNLSAVQLSNAKLEVIVEPLDGQRYKMLSETDLPKRPKSRRSPLHDLPSFSTITSQRNCQPIIEHHGSSSFCSIRFGSLLPGEEGRSSETLAIVVRDPGKLRLHFRILASELPTPHEIERVIECTGSVESLSFNEFKTMFC